MKETERLRDLQSPFRSNIGNITDVIGNITFQRCSWPARAPKEKVDSGRPVAMDITWFAEWNFAPKQIIQAPQAESYTTSWDDYKRQRNKGTLLKRNALKRFCCDASLSARHPGELWRKVKPLLPTSSGKNIQGVILVEGSSVVSDPGGVAEVFSDYFANIIQLEHRSDSDYTDHPSINVRFSSEFNYSPVSTSYIRNILDHLNLRKAVGVDGISLRILRLGSPVLAEKVTKLISFYILNRSLPSEWKQARITPVFKRRIDTDNKPLTSLSKVFEKVIYDQTWNAFHNILSSNLSGFMKTHSCCTALLKMTEDWRNSIDNKEAVAAVAVDFSKASDAINHRLLLVKLKAYGFSPHAFKPVSYTHLTLPTKRIV